MNVDEATVLAAASKSKVIELQRKDMGHTVTLQYLPTAQDGIRSIQL